MSLNGTKSFDIPITSNWYYNEFKEFYGLLCGEHQNSTYEEFISPVFIMNAIERSILSGTEEPIHKFEI